MLLVRQECTTKHLQPAQPVKLILNQVPRGYSILCDYFNWLELNNLTAGRYERILHKIAGLMNKYTKNVNIYVMLGQMQLGNTVDASRIV